MEPIKKYPDLGWRILARANTGLGFITLEPDEVLEWRAELEQLGYKVQFDDARQRWVARWMDVCCIDCSPQHKRLHD